jgi:adenylyltransferase/sulfurtransferase
VLYDTADVGRSKVGVAYDRVIALNPHVAVEPHEMRLTSDNALDILRSYDVVIDATDNFPTRYLINDACVILSKPNVYASIHRFEGQVSVFGVTGGPCYRCLFPEPPPPHLVPDCAEGGVLGVLPGVVGSMQATEALKLMLKIGEPLAGRLMVIDLLHNRFESIVVERDPRCPACGTREIQQLIDYDAFCNGERSAIASITPAALASRLEAKEEIDLIDVREPYEWAMARIEGARLIPLGTLADVAGTLDRSREIVVFCHHGIRSAHATQMLREAGFARVANLEGGIARWSEEVDRSVPQY